MKSVFYRKAMTAFCTLSIIALFVAGCGNPTDTNGTVASKGKDCKKIGVLLPETATAERWEKKDGPLLKQELEKLGGGIQIISSNAEGNADTQQSNADAALTQGACILIVAPADASKASAIVDKAKAEGVPVISYDRLIQSEKLDFYVSFDGIRVGEIQGDYIASNYKSFTKDANNVVMINGGETDNNAKLFYQGAMNKLKPLYDNATLKKVYDQFTPGWNNETALTEMEGALTANQDNIQIAYVANDGMANSVIAALRKKNLNGKVLVTGQDAAVSGIQNILLGDQAMTVYKPIIQEASVTANIVKGIIAGSDIRTLNNGVTVKTDKGTAIPSTLLEPISVTIANFETTVIKDNYVTKAEVCVNLPTTIKFCS